MDKRSGELTLDPEIPEPPATLSPAGLVEWGRVTGLSKYRKCLTPADRAILSIYCGLVAEWEKDGGVSMQTSRMAMLANVAAKLGMDPSSRVKIQIPAEEKPANKFAKLSG